jgi:hypothetical protein
VGGRPVPSEEAMRALADAARADLAQGTSEPPLALA